MISMNTKLTTLLGTKIPMVSAPMYYATTPEMAAAATGAGAFGFIAAGFTPSSTLVKEIQAARLITKTPSKAPVPIGVGLLGWILDKTEASDDPRIPAVLAERPVAIWFAFGVDLGKYVARVREYDAAREHKTIVFVIVNNVDEAVRAANEWKVEVLVVQGNEAGGHGRGDALPLFTLLPSVLAALPSGPVILAAGGISTGNQVAALLTMGADGVVIGSRLLCTPECMYPEQSKEVILNSKLSCTTRSDVFDEVNRTAMWPEGINGRAIVNDIVQDEKIGLDLEERLKKHDESKAKGDSNRLVIWAGDAIGFVNDKESTQSVLHQLHEEAVRAMQNSSKILVA
ncbi:2-nitropropane dioxygenase [Lentinula aff. detonsa]|uniref:2-nitropropane dioxygenase n=1 Tax=Lentinula aff. detonsa TaxID=2804958 RepID=A0AA38KEJ0_9AGAR|nr:2-nitropropane dioxygenase [Lentinula aff. detonsa]KAJ3796758.1 2-nitropropane dioxygenase [Lentinula aff. detonsa]